MISNRVLSHLLCNAWETVGPCEPNASDDSLRQAPHRPHGCVTYPSKLGESLPCLRCTERLGKANIRKKVTSRERDSKLQTLTD